MAAPFVKGSSVCLNLDSLRRLCQVSSSPVKEKFLMSNNSNNSIPTKRINVSIVGEEADLLEKLQSSLNEKLMMHLSMPQVIKRIIRQAAATELK